MTGGLRKRARTYLNVPAATVSDGRLSFKARGILAYLLNKPDGWDVRSVSIAAESELDGKAAVQSGLRELARLGYYRIERRRLLDGRLVTGTAVSEEPVASWAAEYVEYQGPVPVIQQPDGSFQVKRKNGSLSDDGFTVGPSPQPVAGVSEGRVPAGHTGTRFSGAGSAGAGEPGASINTEQPLQTTSPSPVPLPRPPRPASVADLQLEGEEADQGSAAGLDALVAQVRKIRPEWSSRSIRRALAHPEVTERGWDRARRAMLAVAADPGSDQPGRLPHDGPWWKQTPPAPPAGSRPPWCGHCSDQIRRQIEVDRKPARCPACHPLTKKAS